MSQKTILSFFKSSDQTVKKTKNENKNKIVVAVDSPVKKNKNKRKVQCIESDDDESAVISKNGLNGESSESSKISDAKEKLNGCNEIKTSEDKGNEDCTSGKPPKQMKIETKVKNSSPPPTKAESCNSNENKSIEENCTGSSTSTEVKESSSIPVHSNHVDFIPKRKTARKQFNSANKQVNVQVKVKLEPNVEINGKSTNSEIEQMDDSVSVSKKQENSTNNLENKESPVTPKKSPAVKKKGNNSSKSKSSPVKSIHSFFTSIRKTEDKVKVEPEVKVKIEPEDKVEVEPQEDTKNCSVENDDSPIKAVHSKKKKVRCIESDEEDQDSVSENVKIEKSDAEIEDSSKIKTESEMKTETNETKDVEMKDCTVPSVETENKVQLSKVNKKSPEKPSTEEPKKDEKKESENKKFTLKSTSAVDTVYNPAKSNYHPIEDAFWKQNEKVPYLALAKTLDLIENTSGRLKTIEILSNYFRSVIVLSPGDLLHSVYLCLNRVAPEYEGIEMGVGETLLMKAVAQATGRTLDKIKAEVAAKGDLGLVSESSRGNQRVMFTPPKLTVSAVFSKFLEIAKMSGNSAMAKKTDKIKGLFVACRDCEAKYIIRSLSGKLRIGMAEQSILCAIARAAVVTPPGQAYPPEKIDASKGMSPEKFKELLDSQTLILKTAYCECPNYDLVIPVLLKEGISALPERCQLSPGVPLKPMLAHPTAGIDKVLERFDKNAFTCEYKYDGERAQIHMNDKGEVRIFSRNQEDNTSKYPDVISRIKNALKETTKSFILDSEAVAWDRQTKQILPFQVLSTRKRKDAVESEIVVQVCIMAFDLLYINGESLVKKPLKERRDLLHSSFTEVENQFMFAQYRDGDSAETMQEFLDESVKGNCEGLMVKALEVDASYEIAKRSHNWLKLKKDYLQGIGDTLDLVVIGGYFGKGKRTGNYGGFLLACYDEDTEEFQSICKLGTGFKDENLEAHTKFLKQHTIAKPFSYYRYDSSLEPDEWFDSVQVWEIKCADLSISPVHKAAMGIVDPVKGISLRFPRFIRIRDDKTPVNATNSVQIADMYQKQQQIQNTASKNAKAEEDFY